MTEPSPTRRARSDAERAADELAVYEGRVTRSERALAAATAAYEEQKAEHDRLVKVRDHLRLHPALPPVDDDEAAVDDEVPVTRAVRDEPQA